jgi:Transposase DDE domain group 1
MSSDGGVMVLSLVERRLGMAQGLARCTPDRRDPSRITHAIADIIQARVFAICFGYEDADDLDVSRSDPAFKLACGRLLDSGRDLRTQPTQSRLANAPRFKDVIRLTYALVDQRMASYATAPSSVTLDIGDTYESVPSNNCLEGQQA